MDPEIKKLLAEFGKRLILEVRDRAFDDARRIMAQQLRSESTWRLGGELKRLDDKGQELVARFGAMAIDDAIFHFVTFLEENQIKLVFQDRTGRSEDVVAVSDGLGGHFFGWIPEYSSYSSPDEYGDLDQPWKLSQKPPDG